MEYVPSQKRLAANRLRSSVTEPRENLGGLAFERGPSSLEAARAFWVNETLVGDLLVNGFGDTNQYEPGFNPYSYYKDNEEEFKDLEPFVRTGVFDKALNPHKFDEIAQKIRSEKENQRIMGEAGPLGIALGMGAALADVDVTLLFPPLKFAKGGKVAKAALAGVGYGAASAAGTELYLLDRQVTRTTNDALIGIAGGALLGGGIGTLGGVLARRSIEEVSANLNAETPPEMVVGEVGTVQGEREVFGPSTAGAAQAKTEPFPGDDQIAGGTNPLTRFTPLGEVMRMVNPAAREMFYKLADKGGNLTQRNLRGEADVVSAEDYLADFMEQTHVRVMTAVDQEYRQALIDIGAVKPGVVGNARVSVQAEAGAIYEGLTGKDTLQFSLSPQEFQQIVNYRMHDAWTDADWEALAGRFGADHADAILARADSVVSRITGINELVGREMAETGMIEPEQLIENYGIPQLWDYDAILENLGEFRAYWIEKLEGEVPEEFVTENFPGRTVDDLEADPKFKRQVYEAYSDAQYFDRLDAAEARMGEAEDAVRTAREELMGELVELGTDAKGRRIARRQGGIKSILSQLETGLGKLNTRGAEWAVRMTNALQEEQRAEVALIRAERNALVATAEAARTMSLERLEALNELPPTIKAAEDAVTKAEEALFRHVSDFTRQVRERDKARGRWQFSDVEQGLAMDETYQRIFKRLADAEAKHNALIAKTPEAKETPRLARAEERAKAREGELAKAEAEWQRLVAKVNRVEAQVQKVSRLTAKAEETRDLYKARRDELEARLKEQGREFKKARAEVKKLLKGHTAAERVDKFLAAIARSPRTPMGVFPGEIFETGRAKSRLIHLTPAEKRAHFEKGWLKSHLPSIFDRYYRDVGSRIALRRATGTDKVEEMWTPVRQEYERLIETATDPKQKTKLRQEMDRSQKLLEGFVGRLVGTYDLPDDPRSIWAFLNRNVRRWNFLRFGSLFTVGSATDLAQVYFTTGKSPLSRQFWKAANVWRKSMNDLDRNELKALITASEFMLLKSRTQAVYNVDDGFTGGIGTPGTLTNRVTSGIDRTSQYLSDKMSIVNLMAVWNSSLKGIASILQLQNIHKAIKDWDGLSDMEKARMASLGLGQAEVRVLRKYVDLDGQMEDGVFMPDMSLWGETREADYARQVLRRVMRRTQDRSVITPGIADTPLVMSKQLGKLLLQFQTFGFTAANRVLQPMTQQVLINPRDMRSAFTAMQMVFYGALITVARDALYGRDSRERDANDFIYEAIDRSGLISYLSPYADAGIKVFGPSVNEMLGVDLVPAPSQRFIRNAWWQSFLGPSFSTAGDAAGLVSNVGDGEMDKAWEKAKRLAPYSQLIRVGEALTGNVN